MRVNWYIEWLDVLDDIAQNGGVLVLFDLEGKASMRSSPNCAMELALLYQLFGEKVDDQKLSTMRKKIRLVVLTEADIGAEDLEEVIQRKLGPQQKQQEKLFKEAYEKCREVLSEARAAKYLGQWIDDFMKVAGTETSRDYDGTYGQKVSKVRYLQQAFYRLLDDAQLAEYLQLRGPQLKQLNLSFNQKITGPWSRYHFRNTGRLSCLQASLRAYLTAQN